MKTWLVEHIHYFRDALIFVIGVISAIYSYGDTVLTEQDKVIVLKAKEIREQAPLLMEVPKNIYEEPMRQEAEEIYEQLSANNPDMFEKRSKVKTASRILVFASFSLDEAELDDIFFYASDMGDAQVVFRGLKYEEDFTKSISEIQKISVTQNPVTNAVLDPTLFQKYSVTHVPTIIFLDEDYETQIARVEGISNPRWLAKRVEDGQSENFGVKGPVEEILERDLIEVMQQKIAGMDWDKKKEQAVQRFWQKQKFIHLPRAVVDRTRQVDPSIQITHDIKDADGNVIVPAGVIINPLEQRDFNQAVVVFDPSDKRQLEIVDSKVSQLRASYSKVTLIATQFNVEEGWDGYQKITDHYDSAIYKLTSDIHTRFNLQVVPSVITADEKVFYIEEISTQIEKDS